MTELAELFAALPETLQSGIRDLGWIRPTPVQERTIPAMREGLDLIVQARTGSGKTGAFGIPIIERLDAEQREVQALVMLPTRELAGQVAKEITTLGKYADIEVLPIYGGVGYGPQIEALERGVHVVVGTPGRILDHLGQKRLDLSTVKVLVLDEADEMLSLGFWPDMREIRSYLPNDRNSYLFSATIPEKVRSLSRFFLNEPEFVTLSEGQVAPAEIEHFYYVCTAQEKEKVLARVLQFEDPESAIIFCNTKADVRYVTGFLRKQGLDADQISGDLTQAAREEAIGKIKAGKLRFLVATDVAARGIDISDLSHVISYATPESPDVYVHRTGRTGRAGKSGVAISLVSGLDIANFKHLQRMNKIDIIERKPPDESSLSHRVSEKLEVKIEQEMRALPATERAARLEKFIPVVKEMIKEEDGLRDLAAICASYMREHPPVTTVEAPADATDSDAPRSEREPERDRNRDDERPRRSGRRSRGGGSRGGGGRGGGGRGRR